MCLIDALRTNGAAFCRLPNSSHWGLFTEPAETRIAISDEEVIPAVRWLEGKLQEGKYACGFISYEAAKAFDPANTIKEFSNFPLLWISIYEKAPKIFPPEDIPIGRSLLTASPVPEISKDSYLQAIGEIKRLIHDGDTYQVNFTFRADCGPVKSPEELFLSLFKSHPVPYSAFINAGDLKIVSLSPELFLEKISDQISSLPMKGTAKRELTAEKDKIKAVQLSRDEKNRAENVMIVDMVRNDFGRICVPGSVHVNPLFKVQTYRTVHQMISGVHGKLRSGVSIEDILRANFPAPSVTGAPKVRTMQIIAGAELSPRKVYTGSIGSFMPDGNFCLNVAIRTLICRKNGSEMGIGSGIVADSIPEDEWKESLLKGAFANFAVPEFDILETMLWEKGKGFAFLREHLLRARNSQKYFGRTWKRNKVIACLESISFPQDAGFARVRLRILQDGSALAEFAVLKEQGWARKKLEICVSRERTGSKNVFLYHKTTNRKFYDDRFKDAIANGFDEVIFLNENGEVTEGAISNIFMRKDGRWFTPPVSSGLLPGIWRSLKKKELMAREKIISLDELKNADKIIIGNSVRGTGVAIINGQ